MTRRTRSITVGAAALVLAGLLPQFIGLNASAGQTPSQSGDRDTSEYCKSRQSALGAAMPNMVMSVATVCDTPAAKATEKKLASMAAMSAMADMPGMLTFTGSPAQQTVFQGPTNIPRTIGGLWDQRAALVPGTISAIHAVQLYTGQVLLMAGSGNIPGNLTAGKFTTYLWTPSNNSFKKIPTPYDMFCAGHTELANGNILVLGGTSRYPTYDAKGNMISNFLGSQKAYIFNVATDRYQATDNMTTPRWYPTAVTMGDNSIVVAGGLDNQGPKLHLVTHNTDTIEKYTPSTGQFTNLPSMDFTGLDPSRKSKPYGRTFPEYPGLVLMANGNLFYSGESFGVNGVLPGIWNPTTGSYTNVGGVKQIYSRDSGATVLLPPAQAQKVMIMGGDDLVHDVTTNSTQVINLAGAGTKANPKPHYVDGPNLSHSKMFVGGVILPDWTVMETNGSNIYKAEGVNSAEDYNPATNRFTVWNSPTLNRMYHSEAFLLPSGKVAVLGGQPLSLQFEMHVSIFSPPYLFKGQRPTIKGTSTLTRNGKKQGTYTVTVAKGAKLVHLSLIRPSATTHSTDPDQRLVNLPFTHDKHGYHVVVPANHNLAPAGWYMLFATDNVGRPSVAEWVHVS